jgi:short subunit dehydrogenase-like uncharacterized protein
MKTRWMIYGATGYTGGLVVEAATQRGLAPVLAGRRASAVEAIAKRTGLEARSFHLMDPAAAREALQDIAVVANCAGPFSATSGPMITACLAAGSHYVDITGEVAVFESARARDAEARDAGYVVCPGVGFDVIPTDCLAAVLAETLPGATHLALGFETDSPVSRGTAKTVVEGLRTGCLVRRDGNLVAVPLGSRTRRIDFGRGRRRAVAIPWGDVSTAFATAGIPNIEVYLAVPWGAAFGMRLAEFLRGWLARDGSQAWLKRRIERSVQGPDASRRGRTRTWVWGEARDASGRAMTARVETANAYDVTVEGVLIAVRHLLAYAGSGGYHTPTQLLGPRCIESIPGTARITVEESGGR